MPVRTSMLLLLALSVASCASSERGEREACGPSADLVTAIETQRRLLAEESCFRDEPDDRICDTTEIRFERAIQPAEGSFEDETILVVDDLPRLSTSMFRYRDRIAAYVRPTNDGTIVDVPFSWTLPSRLVEAYDALGIPGDVPVDWLEPLAEPLRDAYPRLLVDDVTHGAFVFALLVEPSPRHRFVLLDRLGYTTFASDLFCAPEADDGILARLRERSEAVAESLRDLIASQGIRYVNYSGGWSMSSMRASWGSLCAGPIPSDAALHERLLQMRPVLDVLFATPGVVAAQSADDATDAFEYPFDQPIPGFTNRVRVGLFEALDSGLDAQGRGPSRSDGWPGPGAVDVWLNSGVISTRPFPFNATALERVDAFGTSSDPITLTATSWMAPVATARLVHLRESRHRDAAFDQALAQALLDELVPAACGPSGVDRCRYQDPWLHAQTAAQLRALEDGCAGSP